MITVSLLKGDWEFILEKLEYNRYQLQNDLELFGGSDMFRQVAGDELVALERMIKNIKESLGEK